MQSTLGEQLLQFAHVLQANLFERVALELGPLGERARLLITMLTMVSVRRHVGNMRGWVGRPATDRELLAHAFLAKAV